MFFSGAPGEKPLGAKERTNNKLNSHVASTSGFKPGPHWWEASALTTASPLLPKCIRMEVKIMVKPVLKSFGLKMRFRNNRYLTRSIYDNLNVPLYKGMRTSFINML